MQINLVRIETLEMERRPEIASSWCKTTGVSSCKQPTTGHSVKCLFVCLTFAAVHVGSCVDEALVAALAKTEVDALRKNWRVA